MYMGSKWGKGSFRMLAGFSAGLFLDTLSIDMDCVMVPMGSAAYYFKKSVAIRWSELSGVLLDVHLYQLLSTE